MEKFYRMSERRQERRIAELQSELSEDALAALVEIMGKEVDAYSTQITRATINFKSKEECNRWDAAICELLMAGYLENVAPHAIALNWTAIRKGSSRARH